MPNPVATSTSTTHAAPTGPAVDAEPFGMPKPAETPTSTTIAAASRPTGAAEHSGIQKPATTHTSAIPTPPAKSAGAAQQCRRGRPRVSGPASTTAASKKKYRTYGTQYSLRKPRHCSRGKNYVTFTYFFWRKV